MVHLICELALHHFFTLLAGKENPSMHIRLCSVLAAALLFFSSLAVAVWAQNHGSQIGPEVSIPRHLQDGEEVELLIPQLISFGGKLFKANWTIQGGARRPPSKGNRAPVADPSHPL